MEQQGKPLSFYQLFTEKNLSIQIPIIQRDYAQGRKSEVEVRSNFLEALYGYLEANKPGRELDFIYGAISVIDGKEHFVPLDGQQRLTTLFLLHWYLALISGNTQTLRTLLLNELNKSKFNYETRTSTTEFCNNLLQKEIPYGKYDKENDIAKIISNEGWFFKGWELDPSVAAMLEMLKAIEAKFHERSEYFDRLVNEEHPVIVFQFLNLDQFDLTDDLYIKMNSRGKPLSSFENFKAKLEQSIGELLNSDGLVYQLESSGSVTQCNASQYFSHKVDTAWLNYIWSAGGKQPKLVDVQIMNFVRIILANQTAIHNFNVQPTGIRILFKSQDAVYETHQKDSLSYFGYESIGAFSKATLSKLIQSFDALIAAEAIEEDNRPDSFHYIHKDALTKVFNHSVSNIDRLLFHSFISYLIKHPEKTSGIKEWMRVVYNFVENTRIDGADELTSALREIEKLSAYAPEILKGLNDPNQKIGFFYSRQVEEERVKACLILKSMKWAGKIREYEKHSIFRGQIGFLLDFAGINTYFQIHKNCNWSENEDSDYFKLFCEYANKASVTFDYLQKRSDKKYLWERAVLTKGDYFISTTYNRFHLLTTSLADRDFSWKRLLRLNPDTVESRELNGKRKLVKDVFDDSRFCVSDVVSSCEQIISDSAVGWRSYFINSPKLFASSENGFIRRIGDHDIRILKTTKLTYHYELRTYNLYLLNFLGKDLTPLIHADYQIEYGLEGNSHIKAGEYLNNGNKYVVLIYFKHGMFEIRIKEFSNPTSLTGDTQELQSIFGGLGFVHNGDGTFLLKVNTECEVLVAIENLISQFNTL